MAVKSDERRTLPVEFTNADGVTVRFDISFPLGDGSTMVWGPLSFAADGMATKHSVAWMDDPAFIEAYRRGMSTGHRFGDDLHVEWRVYTVCWAAQLATELEGDFVECGVNTGIFSAAICSYLDFKRLAEKRCYLLDTFAGFPVDQLLPEEKSANADSEGKAYFDSYELVCRTFAEYPNVGERIFRVYRPVTDCCSSRTVSPQRALVHRCDGRFDLRDVRKADERRRDCGIADHESQRGLRQRRDAAFVDERQEALRESDVRAIVAVGSHRHDVLRGDGMA